MAAGDVGRLALRAAVGLPLLVAGVKHARTQAATAQWLAGQGFDRPRLNAALLAAGEVGAGASVLAGGLTTAGSAATVATMTVAIRTVHLENGFSVEQDGYEFPLALSLAAAALATLGPGAVSVDRLLGVDERLDGWLGLAATALAPGAGFGHLAAFWRPDRTAVPIDDSGMDEPEPVQLHGATDAVQ